MPGAGPGMDGAGRSRRGEGACALLDLGFLEDDVLTRDRVELLQFELVGLGPRVLLGHVEKTGIGAADQLDQDGVGLGHYRLPRRSSIRGSEDKALAGPVKARKARSRRGSPCAWRAMPGCTAAGRRGAVRPA